MQQTQSVTGREKHMVCTHQILSDQRVRGITDAYSPFVFFYLMFFASKMVNSITSDYKCWKEESLVTIVGSTEMWTDVKYRCLGVEFLKHSKESLTDI